MAEMVTVFFQPMNRSVEISTGSTVLDAIRMAGIRFESICGGKGECGKCRVIHIRGKCDAGLPENIHGLTQEELALRYCLACTTHILGDAEFIVPVESRIDSPKILDTGLWMPDELSPAAIVYLSGASAPGHHPGSHRSLSLEGYVGRRPHMTQEQHDRLLASQVPLAVTVSTGTGYPEVIGIRDGRMAGKNYGLAIDLGTTTVVGALIDFADGSLRGHAAVLNRQITYGEELITRIAFARDDFGRTKLQDAAIESINAVIGQLTRESGIDTDSIYDVCIGGNTVMNYLLTGHDPKPLELVEGEISRQPIIVRAHELRLDVHPDACVYFLPNVSRFVGGDAVGDVLVSKMHHSHELSLLIDLGTNGELVFGNADWLVSASCASGPAFEGAGIVAGMRAMRGAIEHVSIDRITRQVHIRTIEEAKPVGICGSGIIDAAAEMAAAGILDFAGKFITGMPGVRAGASGEPEFVLVKKEESGTGRDIVITGPDLAYLMDSKAAACGAIGVLMKKYRIGVSDVRHVYLAGAFGTYTNLDRVTAFGIIPRFPNAEYHRLGNGSLAGACAVLTSVKKRTEIEKIAKEMVYIDLLVEAEFIEEYTAALYIPGKKEYFPE